MVPLTLLAMHGQGPTALATPGGHAFEMLFGFALALVAGYLLGPQPAPRLMTLFALWLLARGAHLTAPETLYPVASNAAFALLLAWHLVPKMLAAKKWRNQAIAPLLGLLCAAAGSVGVAAFLGQSTIEHWLLRESVQLFALLMLFMGGRVLGPAVAGEFDRQGLRQEARLQPGLEGALILLVAAAFAISALPFAIPVAGLLLVAAGIIATVRLMRWRIWHCGTRPDLICLAAGYAWLALGLVLFGLAKLTGQYHSAALHVITVGGLGTLATGVMARVALQKARRNPSATPEIVLIAALMAIATLARAGAGIGFAPVALLWTAAGGWSLGFLLLTRLLAACRV
ncbi:MAG: NnrS family protein, partial [Hydrogenophaga sp.]